MIGVRVVNLPFHTKLLFKKNNSVHTFTSMDDVWEVIGLLKEELIEHNKTSKEI